MRTSSIFPRRTLGVALLLLTAAFLSGCEKQPADMTSEDGNGPAITLEGRVALESKATDTSFENGDEVGLTVVAWNGEEPAVLSADRDEDNVLYVYDDGIFAASSAAYYPNATDKVTLWAYYPFAYDGGFARNGSELPVKVQASQNEQENLKASDYLVAEVEGITPSDAAVPMEFRHIMAKIRLNIVLEEGSGIQSSAQASAVMPCLATSALYDMTGDTLTSVADYHELEMFPVDGLQLEAIVVPQTVKAGDYLFYITIGDRMFIYAAEEDMEFVSGTVNEFNALLSGKAAVEPTRLTVLRSNTCVW